MANEGQRSNSSNQRTLVTDYGTKESIQQNSIQLDAVNILIRENSELRLEIDHYESLLEKHDWIRRECHDHGPTQMWPERLKHPEEDIDGLREDNEELEIINSLQKRHLEFVNEQNDQIWKTSQQLANALVVKQEQEEIASAEIARLRNIIAEQARIISAQKPAKKAREIAIEQMDIMASHNQQLEIANNNKSRRYVGTQTPSTPSLGYRRADEGRKSNLSHTNEWVIADEKIQHFEVRENEYIIY